MVNFIKYFDIVKMFRTVKMDRSVKDPRNFREVMIFSFTRGLQCASCSASAQRTHTYDGNGNRVIDLCRCCHALVCDSCAVHSTFQFEGCSWCRNRTVNQLTRLSLPSNQLKCYEHADINIQFLLHKWQMGMQRTYPEFDIRRMRWTKRVQNEGWRFFVDFDFTLIEQHPNQWGMLISMMIKNASAKGYSSQLVVHPSCSRFLRMNPDNQFVYMQTRSFVYMHNFSLVLTSALIKKCHRYSVTMRRYLLSNFAKILLQTLGICRMDDKPKKRN